MSRFVLKFGIICWIFIKLFVAFLLLASLIPAAAFVYVSTILGFGILAILAYHLRQIHLSEGFDLGWFLTVKKGYWRLLVGLFGLILFAAGMFGLIFPNLADELGEKHWLKFASVLVVLFWIALTSTFLSWSLVCFSQSVGSWRLGRPGFGSFGLGFLWLLFAVLFLSLFLDVIDENFFRLSAVVQNWILGVFAVLSIIAGLVAGKFEDLEKPAG